jgi:hypothetical protein
MTTLVFFISSPHKIPEMSSRASTMRLEKVTLLPRVLATLFGGESTLTCGLVRIKPKQANEQCASDRD